jgi:hypothetical protein
VIKSRFWAVNREVAQEIISAMVTPDLINISENHYELLRPEGQIFSRVVPFSAVKMWTQVYTPQGSVEVIYE